MTKAKTIFGVVIIVAFILIVFMYGNCDVQGSFNNAVNSVKSEFNKTSRNANVLNEVHSEPHPASLQNRQINEVQVQEDVLTIFSENENQIVPPENIDANVYNELVNEYRNRNLSSTSKPFIPRNVNFNYEKYEQTQEEMKRNTNQFYANNFTSREKVGSLTEKMGKNLVPQIIGNFFKSNKNKQ